MTEDPALYSDRFEFLRNTAPNKAVKDLVKKSAVAGIGRDGMSPEIMLLVPAEKRKDGDIPAISKINGRVVYHDYFIQKNVDTHPKSMPHWYDTTTENLRVDMTYLMYKFPEVLAINTDGIYVPRSAQSQAYPEKQQWAVSGEIVREQHQGVSFPETGHIDAKSGKHRHPGSTQEKKEQAEMIQRKKEKRQKKSAMKKVEAVSVDHAAPVQDLPTIEPVKKYAPECPVCHTSENIIHNIQRNEYYCVHHPSAIARAILQELAGVS
jgi:hypothetical protein